MPSVVFFTKSVSHIGGKEKMLAGLANYLCGEGYHVQIISYDGSTESVPEIEAVNTLPSKENTL